MASRPERPERPEHPQQEQQLPELKEALRVRLLKERPTNENIIFAFYKN